MFTCFTFAFRIVFQTNVYDTKEIGLVLFLFLVMAEDKVSQLKEELGLESESSTGKRKSFSTNYGMHIVGRWTN